MLPLFALIINHSTYNISDAKISLIFIILFSVISYILIDIKCQVNVWISDNIRKINDINSVNKDKIVSYINKILFLDKLIFFGELVMIIRFVAIILEII